MNVRMFASAITGAAMAFAGAATADELYFSDFESDDGGWEATADWDPVGDWEWGLYDFDQYNGEFNPPPAPFSGDNVWATVLLDDYTNSGGNNWLTQNFDTTGFVNVEMEWANWVEVFFSFDTAELFVNGSLVFERDTDQPPTEWEIESISLPDDMANVEVQFQLFATTVVERAGWYIDDVRITGDEDVPCLMMDIENLVGGETATWTVTGGAPGHLGLVAWGTGGPPSTFEDTFGWCASFGFNIDMKGRRFLIVGADAFDDDGVAVIERPVPDGATGRTILFQAAERGTCPGECMSDVFEEIIG